MAEPVEHTEESLFEAPPLAEQERMIEAILFATAEPMTLREIAAARIILVFGCGGERDRDALIRGVEAEIGRAPLRLLLPARIPLSDLNGSLGDGDGSSLLEKTGDRIQSLLDSIFGKTSWSALAFGPRTGRRARDLLRKMRGGVLGDTSEDLLLQLAAGAREGTWPSWRGPPNARVDYAAHYHNITTAVLVAPAGDEGGTDALFVIDSDDSDGDTVTITSSTTTCFNSWNNISF